MYLKVYLKSDEPSQCLLTLSIRLSVVSVVGDAKEIDWFAPNGEKLLPGRPDISISKTDESSSTLTIYNANVDHAGMYKCVAKSGEKESQGTIIVKIFRK